MRAPRLMRGIRLLVGVTILFAVIYAHLPRYITKDHVSVALSSVLNETLNGRNETAVNSDGCGASAEPERVVVMVKTGATEAVERIPTLLKTSLRCFTNTLIFSDMDQEVGDTKLFDALNTIPAEVTEGNSDFDIYRQQQQLQDPAIIAATLKGMRDERFPEFSAAWSLDKYKFFHVLEKTWAQNPDMDWYLLIDADTYIVRSSLMAWIEKLNPAEEIFFGSKAMIEKLPFAHGGSGIILSGAAMRNLVVEHNGTAARWDYKMYDECCGDFALSQGLIENGIELTNAWPTINGESTFTIPFARDHWCQPLVTLHHVIPAEAEQLANFEAKRLDKSTPIIYSEVFMSLVLNMIPDDRDDWDNMSSDKIVPDITSGEDCAKACTKDKKCFQSLINGTHCLLGTRRIVLGEKHDPEDGKSWHSSWNRERIERWALKQKRCKSVRFPAHRKKKWWKFWG